jgi:hypothetical protein
MYADRQQWLKDLDRWKGDLKGWDAELAYAVEELRRVEAALAAHRSALDNYRNELQGEAELLAARDAAAGEYVSGEPMAGFDSSIEPHPERAARHVQLWDAHERLKRYHHGIIAKVHLLLGAVTEPM